MGSLPFLHSWHDFRTYNPNDTLRVKGGTVNKQPVFPPFLVDVRFPCLWRLRAPGGRLRLAPLFFSTTDSGLQGGAAERQSPQGQAASGVGVIPHTAHLTGGLTQGRGLPAQAFGERPCRVEGTACVRAQRRGEDRRVTKTSGNGGSFRAPWGSRPYSRAHGKSLKDVEGSSNSQ